MLSFRLFLSAIFIVLCAGFFAPAMSYAKPSSFSCTHKAGGVRAQMKFAEKKKGSTFDGMFAAKAGQGHAPGDIVKFIVGDAVAAEVTLVADVDGSLKGMVKLKEVPEGFPVIAEGTLGKFNELPCVFTSKHHKFE